MKKKILRSVDCQWFSIIVEKLMFPLNYSPPFGTLQLSQRKGTWLSDFPPEEEPHLQSFTLSVLDCKLLKFLHKLERS